MEKQPKSYSAAIGEVEKILSRFAGGELDVDTLAAEVRRATELIGWCRERLARAEKEVAEVLGGDKKVSGGKDASGENRQDGAH